MLLLREIVHWEPYMVKMRMFFNSLGFSLAVILLVCSTGCGGEDGDLSEGSKDVPSGTLVNYHPNGAKKLEEFYKGDLRHGLSTTWDENGTIIKQERYENDKLTATIYENGVKVGDD